MINSYQNVELGGWDYVLKRLVTLLPLSFRVIRNASKLIQGVEKYEITPDAAMVRSTIYADACAVRVHRMFRCQRT
ncbi:hypothetical protein D3C81_2163590 [compost metagenome]